MLPNVADEHVSSRTVLLIVALAFHCACGTQPARPLHSTGSPKLIAHRGGVVGDKYAENSPASVEAAIERGYYMLEVDLRESADGRIVLHHDPDFQDFYDHPGLLAEMNWDEISQLRATPGDSRPLEFAELTRLCKGRIQLMLDTKPPEHSAAFFESVETALRDAGLLKHAMVIGTEQSRRWFHGKARIGINSEYLEQAATAGEDVAARYFLFEHGRDLDESTVRRAQELGVLVVPSINKFHYDDLPDHMAAAEKDVKRLRAQGVEYFQIDSPYDRWLIGE